MEPPLYEKKPSASNSNPYLRYQATNDLLHKSEYRKWTDSMGSSELQQLKDLRVEKPQISYIVKGTAKQDAAEWSLASYEPDIAAIIDGEEESIHGCTPDLDAVDAVRHLIAELMAHGNVRLTLDCLALVFGLWSNQGESMTDIGKRNGVSTAAVSKRCIALCKKFGTPVPGGMHLKNGKDSEKTSKKHKQ